MINHSPAQLITELERLMDMDYERLPGARHVLEEAIAVIRPLAEKSDRPVGEMIDPLRALIAQFEYDKYGECFACGALKETGRHGVLYEDSTQPCWVGKLKAALDALLSAPVVNREQLNLLEALIAARDVLATFAKQAGWLPEQQAYSTRMTEGEMQLARAVADLDRIIRDAQSRLSAPVGSPPQEEEHDA